MALCAPKEYTEGRKHFLVKRLKKVRKKVEVSNYDLCRSSLNWIRCNNKPLVYIPPSVVITTNPEKIGKVSCVQELQSGSSSELKIENKE